MLDELLEEKLCQVRRRTCVVVATGCAICVSNRGLRFTGNLRSAFIRGLGSCSRGRGALGAGRAALTCRTITRNVRMRTTSHRLRAMSCAHAAARPQTPCAHAQPLDGHQCSQRSAQHQNPCVELFA